MNRWFIIAGLVVWFLPCTGMEKMGKIIKTFSIPKNPCTGKYELRREMSKEENSMLITTYEKGNLASIENYLKGESWEDVTRDIAKDKQPVKEGRKESIDSKVEIFKAAKKGDAKSIKILLEIDPNLINITDSDHSDRTALAWAARYGHIDAIRELLLKGPSIINKENKKGLRPLEENLHDGYTSEPVMNLLIEKGACIHDGKALKKAARKNNYSAIEILLKKGAIPADKKVVEGLKKMLKQPGVSDSCYEHKQKIVELFCAQEGFKSYLDSNPSCKTELYFAALRGPVAILKTLLGQRVNDRYSLIDIVVPETNDTLLHAAVPYNDKDKINFLLEENLFIDSVNKMGCTPLLEAARLGCQDSALHLILKGANIKVKNKNGEGLWHCARAHKEIHQKVPDANAITLMELVAAFFTITEGQLNKGKHVGENEAIWHLKLGNPELFNQTLYGKDSFNAYESLLKSYPAEVKELEHAYNESCHNCIATQDRFKEKGGRVVLRCCDTLLCKECYDLQTDKCCPACHGKFAHFIPYFNGSPLF